MNCLFIGEIISFACSYSVLPLWLNNRTLFHCKVHTNWRDYYCPQTMTPLFEPHFPGSPHAKCSLKIFPGVGLRERDRQRYFQGVRHLLALPSAEPCVFV